MPTQLREFIELLNRYIEESSGVLVGFQIAPRTKPLKLTALLLVNEILRKAESLGAMCRAQKFAGAEIVVRSALENFVDVENLFRFPDTYPTYLQYLSMNHQRAFTQRTVDLPDSPYSVSLANAAPESLGISVDQVLESTITEMSDLKRRLTRQFIQGRRPATADGSRVETRERHRFVLSGNEHEYEAVYRQLSSRVHGRISSLLDGIIKDGELSWPPELESPPYIEIDLMGSILYLATHRLARKYRRPVTKLNRIYSDRSKLLQKYWGGD